MFVRDQLKKVVEKAIKDKFDAVRSEVKDMEVKVEYPAEESHGDYATAVALELGKRLKNPPRKVAEELVAAMQKPVWVSKIDIAGPGFINFFLAPEYLSGLPAEVILHNENFGKSEIGKGKTVATDISHPNVAKPMGVHHLLSTIIGDSINRMLVQVGYNVIRDNYLGDWGTQFGKLIYAYKTWGDEKKVKADPIPELLKLYVHFHEQAEKDPSLEELGRAEFKKLEDGDSENRNLWKWVVDLSLVQFHKIWDRLGVTFDYIHGESFYEDKMQEIIDLGIKKGIFVKGEGGALIAPFKHEKYPPCLIKKSDGATTYATRDLARVKYWEDSWHPELMVNVVDSAQQMHFEQFFEVSEMLGLTKAKNIHVSFGRMSFPEKKMSTRKGNIIELSEVLDEAEERAFKVVDEKNPEMDESKKREVARMVGIGSVKYAVLSQNRNTNVTFTWDKMLSLEGNSAPYLQYVHARACSILRKAKAEGVEFLDAGGALKTSGGKYIFNTPQELAITRALPKFAEVIAKSAEDFKPNLIANFLYDVAGRFNSFYAAVPVMQEKNPDARLARLGLVRTVTIVLKNGLSLLGIESPEEM